MSKSDTVPRMKERDGYKCLYCPLPFTDTHPAEIEHLDNNHNHNQIWNKAFAHHECNNRKKFNTDMQIIANEKILSNKKYVYACERKAELTEVSSSEQRNRQNKPIALQFITEHLMVEPYLLLRDAVNAITHLCFETNGTGSQQATRNYIEEFCNPINGKFELTENERGQKIIRKRIYN